MRVTIIADASHCHETRATGYAFWIATDRGKHNGQGHAPGPVVNSIAAEMMALLHGTVTACITGLLHPGDTLLLQTDCMAAIDAFCNRRHSITAEEVAMVKEFNELLTQLGVKTEYRHVKGHSAVKDARSHINRLCDTQAGEEMRKARAKFRVKPVRSGRLSMGDMKEEPEAPPFRLPYRTRIYEPWDGYDHFHGLSEEDLMGRFPGDSD